VIKLENHKTVILANITPLQERDNHLLSLFQILLFLHGLVELHKLCTTNAEIPHE